MSIYNMFFCGEIRKVSILLDLKSILSRAMDFMPCQSQLVLLRQLGSVIAPKEYPENYFPYFSAKTYLCSGYL